MQENTNDRKVIKVLVFNNKGQVAQILVQEHKWVPVECYVEYSPSKFAWNHKNARQLTINHYFSAYQNAHWKRACA